MIDYLLLAQSQAHYEKAGFVVVETPWLVPPAINRITAPADSMIFEIENWDAALVASGEQSFLAQYMEGFLPPGRFQTITPCFRDDNTDEHHRMQFMKNELIDTTKRDPTLDDVQSIATCALRFFHDVGVPSLDFGVGNTPDEIDILSGGIEIGSYGIRKHGSLTWIYGTGLAEPRTSSLLNRGK